jgi:hypothetical protein
MMSGKDWIAALQMSLCSLFSKWKHSPCTSSERRCWTRARSSDSTTVDCDSLFKAAQDILGSVARESRTTTEGRKAVPVVCSSRSSFNNGLLRSKQWGLLTSTTEWIVKPGVSSIGGGKRWNVRASTRCLHVQDGRCSTFRQSSPFLEKWCGYGVQVPFNPRDW